MKKIKVLVPGLLCAVALLGSGQAQAYLIDNFDFGVQTVAEGPPLFSPTDNVASGLGADAVGTTRSLFINDQNGQGAFAFVTSAIPKRLSYSTNDGGDSKLIVTWDGNNSANTTEGLVGSGTFAPVNLLDGCSDADSDSSVVDDCYLRFRITSLDLNLLATVYLRDADGTIAYNTFVKVPSGFAVPLVNVIPDPDNAGGGTFPGNLYHGLEPFLFGGTDPFTGDPFGGHDPGLDLTRIVAIQLVLDTRSNLNAAGASSLDVGIDCIDTGNIIGGGTPSAPGAEAGQEFSCTAVVPEPGTMLLLGTGLLAMTFFGAGRRYFRSPQA